MKKTITKPDGTTEVVEGTAEEIAEYERKVKGEIQKEAPQPKGPGLLTEKLSLAELLEKYRRDNPKPWWEEQIYNPLPRWEHSPTCQLIEAQRGWMSIIPPRCTCGLILYPDQSYTRIITVPNTNLPNGFKWEYSTWCSNTTSTSEPPELS